MARLYIKFKIRVYKKRRFNDSIRMERLISVIDGEAKRVLTSVGQSVILYGSTLDTLKRDFDKLILVSYMKLKDSC